MRCWQTSLGPVAVLALAFVAGCGKGSGGDSEGTGGAPSAREALTDLVNLLKHLEESGKRPPARLAEVESVEALFPGAYLGLVRGEVVYYWGKPLDPSASSTVLAYEKKAPAEGGYVLFQDGTVKKVTAGEFQSAPQAKK